ncbi:MAG: transglycosylase domain-containing protein [Nitrospirota bacterium]
MALHKLIKLPQLSIAISADEQPVGFVYTEYRINALYEELPKHLIQAVISAEDKRFFFHRGFDPIALLRAFWKNLKYFSIVQGGSTITQQLARVAIIRSNKRTLKRKLLELITAINIERIATKKEILEAYLNAIYLGHNIFGVKIAAWKYFNKDVSDLDLNESAYLAGLIRAPNRYCLSQSEELVNKRKDKILELMHKNNFISKEVLIKHKANSVVPSYFQKPYAFSSYPDTNGYYLDYVKKYLLKNHADLFPFRQMIIRTTFDRKCQTAIDQTVKEIASNNRIQKICCLILDKNNGGVKAIRSGIDCESEYFNTAINGYLQPGSTIKPFILAEALNQGFSLESKFESKKLCIDIAGWKKWEVKNFNDIYRGRISLAEALIYSDNTVFAQLILHLNMDKLKEFLKRVGIDVGIPTPALATGATSKGVSPLQVAASYTVFSNRGYYLPPTPIIELKTITGENLFKSKLTPCYVLDNSIAGEIDDVLKRVVAEGTGIFRNLTVSDLRAKTGTTNTDSWYVSYDDKNHLLTWVGEKSNYECNRPEQSHTFPRPTDKETECGCRNPEKAITAKQLAKKIWYYLQHFDNFSHFGEVAKGVDRLKPEDAARLEGYFLPWGRYGNLYS